MTSNATPYLENPFTPSFGQIPAHLAGRTDVIQTLTRAFDSTLRRPDLTTVFSGARGTGKTALLSYLANQAQERGWVVASTTAIPGMLEDIELRTLRNAQHLVQAPGGPSISEIGIPQIVDIKLSTDASPSNWRLRMDRILDQLEQHHAGLLITVDEIDPNLDEMVQLAAIYQHFVRENRKVALLMAGLPHNVSALLNNKTVSFLRRAQTVALGRVSDLDVVDALFRTVQEHGRTITQANLDHAARAINGFPFMIQLVGYRAWDQNPSAKEISSTDLNQGIELAKREMKSRIIQATFQELTDLEIQFLAAMAQDSGDSNVSDIQARLDRSASVISQYKRRLIDAGIIGERRRGIIGFDLPFFREYLLEFLGEYPAKPARGPKPC
ncbi:MAG: AAA family ATPase [Eggerthellales bacterium]|nr:AAA family ATPase [Eggerthellales bacterium]